MFRIFFSCLVILLLSSSAFAQSYINVAYLKKVSVRYAVNDPAFMSKHTTGWNPQLMVDGTVAGNSFFDLVPGQAGTQIRIDLDGLYIVNRIVTVTYPRSAANFRIRAYSLWLGRDTLSYHLVKRVSNNVLFPTDDTFDADTARYVMIQIDSMDASSNPSSTTIAEIEVYPTANYPWIGNVTLASSSSEGKEYRDILWSVNGFTVPGTVDIYYSANGTPFPFVPYASNVPNSGRCPWKTLDLPDGTYKVAIVPNLAEPRVSGRAKLVLQNFSNLSLQVQDNRGNPLGIRRFPRFYSPLLGDSLKMVWTFNAGVLMDHSFRFSRSADSGRTWIPFHTFTDTSARSMMLPVPNLAASALWSTFRWEAMRNGVIMASVRYDSAMILSSSPPGVSVAWRRPYPATVDGQTGSSVYAPFSGSMAAYPASPNGTTQRIVVGPAWMVSGSGETIEGWWHPARNSAHPAVARMDSTVTPTIVYGLLTSVTLSADSVTTWQPFTTVPTIAQLVDIEGDGTKEIVHARRGKVAVLNRGGHTLAEFPCPVSGYQPEQAAIVDVNHDGRKELVFPGGNSLVAVGLDGIAFPDIQVTFPQTLLPWVLAVDFDLTGRPDIVVGSNSVLWSIRPDGSHRPGFPIALSSPISNRAPAVADVDADGHPELVLISEANYAYLYANRTSVNVVNRFGQALSGWPTTVYDDFGYDVKYPGDTVMIFGQTFIGYAASPLITSIDGDTLPEIILTTSNGWLYIFNSNGTVLNGFPMYFGGRDIETYAMGDFDGNGSMNLLLRTFRENHGTEELVCLDFGPNSFNPRCVPWPMYLQNPARTGIWPTNAVQQVPTSADKDPALLPGEITLEQNYPNPFNAITNIQISNPKRQSLILTVYDLLGREVAEVVNGVLEAGMHKIAFDAGGLASGVYVYALSAGTTRISKTMVVLK